MLRLSSIIVLWSFILYWHGDLTAAHAGGTVTGKVTYSGQPETKEFVLSKFPNSEFCSKHSRKEFIEGDKRVLPTITVSKDGGLAAAVVAVTDIEDNNFVEGYKGTDIRAEFCEFQPYTGVVVNKQTFRVENHDADPEDPKSAKGVLHNPHSFEVKGPSSTTIFNVGLAEKGSHIEKRVVLRKEKQGSHLRLQCDQHEFMQSFFFPVKNPYYAVVDQDGTFEIKNVPAGRHTLIAWHPFAGRVEGVVDVPEGGTAEGRMEIKK